jgi:hypothetical protein
MMTTQIQRRQKELKAYEKNKISVIITFPNKDIYKKWEEFMQPFHAEYSWHVVDKKKEAHRR